MNRTPLEERLTTAMTQTPDAPPDPAVLRRIQAAGRKQAPTVSGPPRLGFVSALAVGAAAMLALVLTFSGADTRTDQNQTAAGDSGVASVLVSPPSYGWLVAIALLGAGAVAARRRSRVGPQEVAALVVLTLGILVSVGATLPSIRAGAALTQSPPELTGLQPVDSSLRWWPGLNEPLVEFRYQPVDGRPLATDGPDAEASELARIADAGSFDTGLPNRGQACRRYLPDDYDTSAQPIPWDVGRFYCLAGSVDGDLVVTGEVVHPNWTWWRYVLGYPLVAFGLLLGLLAAVDARRASEPSSAKSQFAFGLVLLLLGIPLFLLGWLGFDAIRVANAGPFVDCRFSAALTDAQFLDCRAEITETLTQQGLLDAGMRLYWPVLVIADMFGAIMVTIAIVIAAGLTKAHLGPGRRRLVAAMLVLLVLTLVPQALYYDTIQITTDVFE